MDPVEINAGACYLRALRADSRIDDSPALLELGETDPNYVGLSAARWSDAGYSWAVCEPTTGKLLAEVTLDPTTGDIGTRALDGHACVAVAAGEAVQRFGAAIGIAGDVAAKRGPTTLVACELKNRPDSVVGPRGARVGFVNRLSSQPPGRTSTTCRRLTPCPKGIKHLA